MRPSSSPSKRAVLRQNSTRPSHRHRRRLRFELQLERLEDRQLLSGSTSSSPVLFHDTFSSNTPSSAWSFVGGTLADQQRRSQPNRHRRRRSQEGYDY